MKDLLGQEVNTGDEIVFSCYGFLDISYIFEVHEGKIITEDRYLNHFELKSENFIKIPFVSSIRRPPSDIIGCELKEGDYIFVPNEETELKVGTFSVKKIQSVKLFSIVTECGSCVDYKNALFANHSERTNPELFL